MKLLRFLLFPFAILYDIITSIRNFLFDKGILKSSSFDIPIIAVGNLSVGGTGKSPQIEYLVKLLQDQYKVAILSRGYKRKSKGFLLLNKSHTVEDVGDEPLQFFNKFENISVAVDSDRTYGITQLKELENSPEVILLDDAFQHRKVKAKVYILLTKYKDLYVNDFILPTGNLRESRRGAIRANVIIVTKCPQNIAPEERNYIIKSLKTKKKQKVFFSTIWYAKSIKSLERSFNIEDLKQFEVLLITGIANPEPLFKFLSEKEIKFQHLNYPDHHNFSEKDIVKINRTFGTIISDKKLILTTEKDFVRLEKKLDNLFYLPIETSFLENKNVFDKTIKSCIIS